MSELIHMVMHKVCYILQGSPPKKFTIPVRYICYMQVCLEPSSNENTFQDWMLQPFFRFYLRYTNSYKIKMELSISVVSKAMCDNQE